MKKLLLLSALFLPVALFAQPQLREDNIDEIVKAMTIEEKAALLAGTGDVSKVPGARRKPDLAVRSSFLAINLLQ